MLGLTQGKGRRGGPVTGRRRLRRPIPATGPTRITLDYEIDLSAANEERLREKLAKFLDAATPVGPRRARTTAARKTVKATPASRDQTQAIREWARGAGYVVSERGRIPKNVQEAFNQAH